MARAKHYCADCDSHFGGSPNNITPEEHANIAHNSGMFRGVQNGNYKDWKRKQQFRRDKIFSDD
jgi:hypothetical protein